MSISTTATATVFEDSNGLRVTMPSKEVNYKNAKKFVRDISKVFKNTKAVMLNVFGYQPNGNGGFKSNLEFCKAVKEKFDSLGIRHKFTFAQHIAGSLFLFTAKIDVQFHDTVLFVMDFIKHVSITEYEYTPDGYKVLSEKEIPIDVNENAAIIRQQIIGTSTPEKIILATNSNHNLRMKTFKTALKSQKLIVFETTPDTMEDYLVELSKWMFDKSYTKYHIIPTSARQYILLGQIDEGLVPLIMMEQFKDLLPCTKTAMIPSCFNQIIYGDLEDRKNISGVKVIQKCHQIKATFNVDADHFLDVKCEGIIYPKIQNLRKTLDSSETLVDSKIPVIGIMNNLSVICVLKDDGYDFLNAWNGFYGKEIAASFDEQKPKVCNDAFRVLPEKPTFVVYDLLKVMSMHPDEVKINVIWKFSVTKDENYPLLFEFDNFDGSKKFATPAFLMALLLKYHLKAIKEEMGEKPAEIGICILEEFNEAERKRVEEGLKESCELLNVGYKFIDA